MTKPTTAEAYADYVRGIIEHSRVQYDRWLENRLAEAAAPKPSPLMEMYEGKMREVVNPDRQGWWRFHDHYDRDGYCDNPGRGY